MLFPRALALAAALTSTTAFAQSDWDFVRTGYGLLTHIAGAGNAEDVNSWIPAYEGGGALTAELSNPHMAQADAAGNIYIADKESNSILKVTPAGIISTVAGTHVAGFDGDGPALSRQLNQPNGLFVLADGTFYILDLENLRIRRVGADGQLTTVVEETSLLAGRALWVSPDEQLIYYAGLDAASSPSLKRWTPATGIEVVASGFVSMGNISVDHEGNPLVTEDTGNRVFRIETDGAKTLIAGNGSTFGGGDGMPATSTGLDRVRGIAPLPGGGFFLATQKGAHIWHVDAGGIIHKFMDCSTSGNINAGNGQPYDVPGVKMSEPRAITIAPNGDLIIVTNDTGQIRAVKATRAPAVPSPIDLERDPNSGGLRLRWTGPAWQTYFIDFSPSLTPAAWQPIGLRTTLPGDTFHPVPGLAGALEGFYRARVPGGGAIETAAPVVNSAHKKIRFRKHPRRSQKGR